MHDALGGDPGRLSFELITGGHSNLTFHVRSDDGRRWVLRRPPMGQVLATAHDMSREHRLIDALATSDVPVPPLVGLCTDETVNGAPFFVMDFVEGTVVRTGAVAEQLTLEQRRTASRDLMSVMAKLHAIDPDDVGLGDLGKKEDYVGRQLRRWLRQFDSSTARELPIIHEVHSLLSAKLPEQGPAGIVHGDYRLDNCILADDGTIAAVLDWELCTLGEVRADLGLLMVYWAQDGDPVQPLENPPTMVPGFATRPELAEWYQTDTGRDLSDLDYFVAFSYWRLACILEGVYSRYVANVMGDHVPADLEGFGRRVVTLAELAHQKLLEAS